MGTLARTGTKIVLAILLLVALTHLGALSPSALLRVTEPVAALRIAMGCVVLALGLGVYRWQLVMAAAGVRVPYLRALQMYWVGAFASTLLPGAVSGDILRAVFVIREAPHARTRAAISVIADRIIGLLGFVLTGLILLTTRFDALRDSPALRDIAATLCGVLAVIALIVFAARRLAATLRTATWARRVRAPRPHPSDPGATDRMRVPALLAVLLISLTIPLLLTGALLPFLPGPPLTDMGLVDIAIASVSAQVANTIPLTPGGIGIGEGIFDYVLALLQPATAAQGYATAFLSLRLVSVCVNGAGGLLLLVPGNPFAAAMSAPQPHINRL